MQVAVDSSTLIAFFNGETSPDIKLFIRATEERIIVLPPVVITEVLSSSEHKEISYYLENIPVLPITDGYWERVAEIRRVLIAQKFKSRLADAMIAQSCLDANIPLITRDKDFRHYEKFTNLKLANIQDIYTN